MSDPNTSIPLPPITAALQRIIDEPWRRVSTGKRIARNAIPTIVTSPAELEVEEHVES